MKQGRREFIGTGLAAAGGLAWPGLRFGGDHFAQAGELILRGAVIYDGTGNPPIGGDVLVRAGRIATVGSVGRAAPGVEEISLRGLALAPGFIDVHSHGDGTLADDPMAESVIRQGITTIVVGQDGDSPSGPEGTPPTVAGYFRALEAIRPAVNVATMIGLGTVRAQVVGEADRRATTSELATMVQMVESALAVGACGASSGLEYTPGGFAPLDELIALSGPLRRYKLPYSTHLRNEDDRLLEAIDEAMSVAEGAGCPLQVSHLKAQGPRNWAKMGEALARLDRSKKDGVDAAFDIYPYVAYQTGLSNLFPLWSRDGGTEAFLARLDAPATADRIRALTLAKVDLIGGWDNVLISGVANAADSAAAGQRMGALAAAKGADPYQLAGDLLRRSRGNVGMVGFAMSEENVERGLAHPKSMICSDGSAVATEGPARRGHPHPRSLGTFPRVLGHYVRERKVLSLESAIHKMTARSAARLRIRDRGTIAPGMAADLVAFDPDAVADRATFADPFQYPAGIALVLVNGAVVYRGGERTGERPGRPVVSRTS